MYFLHSVANMSNEAFKKHKKLRRETMLENKTIRRKSSELENWSVTQN